MKAPLPKCKGFMGYLFGHRFEARYSKAPPSKEASLEEYAANKIEVLYKEFKPGDGRDADDKELKLRAYTTAVASIREIFKKTPPGIYTRDICIHCGFVVENYNIPVAVSGERRLDTEL